MPVKSRQATDSTYQIKSCDIMKQGYIGQGDYAFYLGNFLKDDTNETKRTYQKHDSTKELACN